MKSIQDMIDNELEQVNEESEDEVSNRVKVLVRDIIRYRVLVSDTTQKIVDAQEELKKLRPHEEVKL